VLLFETPETTLPRLDHSSTILPATVTTHIRPKRTLWTVGLRHIWWSSGLILLIARAHCAGLWNMYRILQDEVDFGCEVMKMTLSKSAKP
jgi:hypothetical protein